MRAARFLIFLSIVALPLSVRSQNIAPTITATIPDTTLYRGVPAAVIDLAGFFTDPTRPPFA